MPSPTLPIPALTESDKARFWAKVDRNGPTMPHMDSPCWEWTAFRLKEGYGRFGLSDGKIHLAHRIAFVLAAEVFPEGKANCLHRCDNPPCCNPDHLFAGDGKDNTTDMMSKGRGISRCGDASGSRLHPEKRPRGESHKSAKLTNAQCAFIKSSPLSGRALGRELGVSGEQINRIRRGASRSPTVVVGPASVGC